MLEDSSPSKASCSSSQSGVFLSEDLLGLVFKHLDPLELLRTVPLVCKKWYSACLHCPALWASAEFVCTLDAPGVERLQRFKHWLSLRASFVKFLHFCSMGTGLHEAEAEVQQQVWELLLSVLRKLAPSLQRLDLQWFGPLASLAWVLPLQGLSCLELDAHSVEMDVPLAQLTRLTRLSVYTLEGKLGMGDRDGLLPPTLQQLSVLHATPLQLPASLGALSSLQRIYMSECALGEGFHAALCAANSLQHLAVHCCQMPRLPPELGHLTNLRALLLDSNEHPQDEEALGEVLAPLEKLQILGLSNCRLRSLPSSVTGLTSLRCLYTEENRLSEVPLGPYLRGLQILSLDWRALLGCGPRLLAATPCLRQLYACRAFPFLAPAGDNTRPRQLAAVVEALRAHPALQRLVFVLYDSVRLSQQVEMTRMVLALAQQCPRLQLDCIPYDQFFAVNLDTIDTEVG